MSKDKEVKQYKKLWNKLNKKREKGRSRCAVCNNKLSDLNKTNVCFRHRIEEGKIV
jgi:uncharacterized protein with PIN domain